MRKRVGYERSEFEVQVRPWIAIFFLLIKKTFNNRSKNFCLKNGSDRLQKGHLHRRGAASLRYRNRAEIILLMCEQKPYPVIVLAGAFAKAIPQWRIQGRGPGAPPSPPPTLFLDQTEVRRAEKNVFGDCPPPPLSKGLDDPPALPPPIISRSGSGTVRYSVNIT